MFRVILQKFVIILVYQFFVESTADILNLFKPQPDLPQQLNDFLIDVQQHKKDFAFIRNVAKNRRKYEKSYAENHNLFAEDLDNQLTLSPYYSKRLDGLDNRNPRPNIYDQMARSPEHTQGNNFRSYFPNERYSKFIRSPVRLQRELEANYLDTHVKLNPNGIYGEIKRAEPKFPGNRFANDENKYRADYMVGVEDKDNGDDYSEFKPSNKKKREVEISIKSDGKLVKRIEEDENGPKSIILNIKAPADEKSKILGNPAASQVAQSGATIAAATAGQSSQNNKNVDSGPSNSKSIPSLSNSNQDGGQNKKFGVPINSIPASNNAYSNNKNGPSPLKQNDESKSDLNSKNAKESVSQDKSAAMQKYNLPEVSNSQDGKQKIDTFNSKSFGENFENSRWSGDSNQMAKSIDIAQNNVNKFIGNKDRLNMNADLEEPQKESEFEKIQGLVVDSTEVNDMNQDLNIKYANKRESVKKKRFDETLKGIDENNIPLDVQDIQANGAANGAFDYSLPLQQEANDLNNPNSGQELPESINWKAGDQEIHLNPNQKYQVIEQSTKNILILPIIESTTPCVIDVHVPNDDGNLDEEEKVEQAKMIGNAIAQEIKKDEKAEAEKEREENHEGASDIPFPNHEEEKEEDEKEAEIEIIKHKEDEKHKDCRHDSNKESGDGRKEIERLRHSPREYHHENRIRNQSSRKAKRQIVKKKKSRTYVVKQKGNNGKKHNSGHYSESDHQVAEKNKREQQSDWSDDALRNRKHMPPIPKYKKKRVRQHPKKRVNRIEEEPSLVDYYNFNELYGPPDDTFDFIPSFYKRQLRSLNYEYDPNVIHDIGDHDEEEIRKFEKAEDEKEKLKKLKPEEKEDKFQGHRKKFKSEGDYSDEEESNKSISKKIPKKKTRNQFASVAHTTTEDNDDDYNYEDLSDMQDEEEDVAYEEENPDNIDVDEAVGNNTQSDDDTDRLQLNKVMESYLAFPVPRPTLKGYTRKYLIMKVVPFLNDKKFLGDAHENENDVGRSEEDKASVSRGHGSSNKKVKMKKQKKKPKRNDESGQIMKTENQDLAGDMTSFHGRGNRGFKLVKHKQAKPKREDIEPVHQKENDLTKAKVSSQFEEKPLSSQEKQDIFLRYNPEFQRWPRFVQNDNIYKDLMKKRALEHQKRYFRKAHDMDMFPISNGYFLNPERPVKREEPATEETGTAAASTGASEAAASTGASEAAASTGASEAAASAAEGATQSSTAESFAEQKEQASETTPNMETEGSHAPENINGATLPQAAKNILQTANSDIFENTTVPSLEETVNGNSSAGAAGGQVSGSEQTQFRFTTTAEDLTENTLCMTPHKDISPCPDEGASHSPVTITSVLPLVPESVTLLKINMTKAEYLDLNDIVGGALPRHIVSHSLSNAKGNIRQGLNTGKFNMNINVSNYNSNAETKLILNEMTNLMLKLKYHTTCQALPANLKTYVKLITKNEMDNPMSKIKEMEEIDFDEHQSSYVFHGGEGDSIQNKAQALRDLLGKYNTLPDNCKERAEPVREYIESHLAMIDNVNGNGNNKGKPKQPAGAAKPTENSSTAPKKEKKEISLSNSETAEEKDLNGQMMEDGLNNQHPDANEAIEDKDKKSKREAEDAKFPPVYRRELSTSTSPQYGKLAEAVRKLRTRRASEKRIGEIYGRAKREDDEKLENEEQSKKDKGFESPLVINF